MTPQEPSQRIGFTFADGSVRYYDIDPDGKVYWLRPRGDKLQRYAVEADLAERIKHSLSASTSGH